MDFDLTFRTTLRWCPDVPSDSALKEMARDEERLQLHVTRDEHSSCWLIEAIFSGDDEAYTWGEFAHFNVAVAAAGALRNHLIATHPSLDVSVIIPSVNALTAMLHGSQLAPVEDFQATLVEN